MLVEQSWIVICKAHGLIPSLELGCRSVGYGATPHGSPWIKQCPFQAATRPPKLLRGLRQGGVCLTGQWRILRLDEACRLCAQQGACAPPAFIVAEKLYVLQAEPAVHASWRGSLYVYARAGCVVF